MSELEGSEPEGREHKKRRTPEGARRYVALTTASG